MTDFDGMSWVKIGTKRIFGAQPLIAFGYTTYSISEQHYKYKLKNIHILCFTYSVCTQYGLF